MKIVLARQARRELVETATFYLEQSGVALARSFIDDFEGVLTMLRKHPEIGSPCYDRHRRMRLARFLHDVVYRVTGTGIRTLAIAHQRREPGYWRDRT